MSSSFASRLRYALLGAAAAALVFVTTTALAGSGVGGVFNLGQMNTVDAQSSLAGNPGGQPELKVVTQGTAAAVRGEAVNGIGINGISDTGTGQQGLSQSGIGLFGTHGATTGIAPGVQGETNSTDPNGAGVVGRNNGGGPGLKAIVNASAAPLMVNSQVKVTNLNADKLDDLDSAALQRRVSAFCISGQAIRVVNVDGSVACEPVSLTGAWSLTGNTGTSPGKNFLGTTDNQALELKVDGQRALRIEPNPDAPNLIGGFSGNTALPGAVGATVGGGGLAAFPDIVGGNFSTIGGGLGNTANAVTSTVGGGFDNAATGDDSTVPGGASNTAAGLYSFAAGRRANANNDGTFVWSDSQSPDMVSSGDNQFIARASGHFFLQSDSSLDNQGGFINTSTGAFLSTGGTWTNASSRTLKAGFHPVRPRTILRRVSTLPISSWHYRAEPRIRHIGPASENFHRAFGLGADARSIGTVDADGVALAAIQGLYRENQALKRRLARLEREVSRMSR